MIDLERFLRCSSLIEKKTAEVYLHLAENSVDPVVRGKLLYIAYDTLKHYLILSNLTSSQALPKDEECMESFGDAFHKLTLLGEFSKKSSITTAELREWVSKLDDIETFVGEELFSKLIYALLQRSGVVRRKELEEVLAFLVNDENRHREILAGLLAT